MSNEDKAQIKHKIKNPPLGDIVNAYLCNFIMKNEIHPSEARMCFYPKEDCNCKKSFIQKLDALYQDDESFVQMKDFLLNERAIGILFIDEYQLDSCFNCVIVVPEYFFNLDPTSQLALIFNQTNDILNKWHKEHKRTK